MSDLRTKIRSANGQKVETVDIPEWGVTVELRPMSVNTRLAMRDDDADDEEANLRATAKAIVASAYDPKSGELVFTDEDVDWLLAEADSGAYLKLSKAMAALAGLSIDAVEEGKDA